MLNPFELYLAEPAEVGGGGGLVRHAIRDFVQSIARLSRWRGGRHHGGGVSLGAGARGLRCGPGRGLGGRRPSVGAFLPRLSFWLFDLFHLRFAGTQRRRRVPAVVASGARHRRANRGQRFPSSWRWSIRNGECERSIGSPLILPTVSCSGR